MKKLILVTALAAVFAGGAMADEPAQTAVTGGKITFKGKVVDQTCVVKTESRDQIVVLQNVPKNKLAKDTDTAMPTPFHINLQGCTTQGEKIAKKVKASFSSPANVDTAHNYTLRNILTSDSAAKNVNIQLFMANGTDAIYPSRQKESLNTPEAGRTTYEMSDVENGVNSYVDIGTNAEPVLHYIAKYYATGAATVGDVETSVNFELTYE